MMTPEQLMEALRDLEDAGKNQAEAYELGTGASKAEMQARALRVELVIAGLTDRRKK